MKVVITKLYITDLTQSMDGGQDPLMRSTLDMKMLDFSRMSRYGFVKYLFLSL